MFNHGSLWKLWGKNSKIWGRLQVWAVPHFHLCSAKSRVWISHLVSIHSKMYFWQSQSNSSRKAFPCNSDTCFQSWYGGNLQGDVCRCLLSSLAFAAETFRGFVCSSRQRCILGVWRLILPASLGFCLKKRVLCLLLSAALGSVSSPAGFYENRVGPCMVCRTRGQNAFCACSKEGLLPPWLLRGAGVSATLPVTLRG